jgi:uncharacterized Rmd1/YagE family protein
MTPTRQTMRAFNVYDIISIKAVRQLYAEQAVDSAAGQIQVKLSESTFLFVFRFGGVVFFNASDAQIATELDRLKRALGPGMDRPTTESFDVALSTQDRVDFEQVQLKDFSPDKLALVAQTLAQSAALEYFEVDADKMLRDTSSFMEDLAKFGRVSLRSKSLLKIIGTAAGRRQHIASNLAILDPPDTVWSSNELERLFKELQQNFEVETRFKVLDRKLGLVQENIEILVDLVSTRRAHLLEWLIIVLIAVELVLALVEKI